MSDTTMTLADGTVIDMVTGRPVERAKITRVPTEHEAVREITRVRRRLHELPDIPERMNTFGVVAMYHLFGLQPVDIAIATNLTQVQVENIMQLDGYKALLKELTEAQLAAAREDVRACISELAPDAVQTMREALADDDMRIRVVAAKDVLDRSGHRPADVVEHRHKVDGELRIEYVKRDVTDIPAISTDYKEITDGDGS